MDGFVYLSTRTRSKGEGMKGGRKTSSPTKPISNLGVKGFWVFYGLVQLQGWFYEYTELVLFSYYLSNVSLSKILHRNSNSTRGSKDFILVASALTYLHEECERQIMKRNVKT